MTLAEYFNTAVPDNVFLRTSDCTLETSVYVQRGPNISMVYDFLGRVMYAMSATAGGGVTVTPFAQLDRETLEFMRNKLQRLGGKPPELPALPAPEETNDFCKPAPARSAMRLG